FFFSVELAAKRLDLLRPTGTDRHTHWGAGQSGECAECGVHLAEYRGGRVMPSVTRMVVLRDAAVAAGSGQLGAIQSVAPQLELHPVGVRDASEIERGISAFAREWNGGLIVTGSSLAVVHRNLIVTLAARHKLPTVYYRRLYVTGGGLLSFGPVPTDQYPRAA